MARDGPNAHPQVGECLISKRALLCVLTKSATAASTLAATGLHGQDSAGRGSNVSASDAFLCLPMFEGLLASAQPPPVGLFGPGAPTG